MHICKLFPARYRDDAELTIHSQADSLETATLIRVIPKKDKGKGEIVPLQKKFVGQDGIISEKSENTSAVDKEVIYSFVYQQDTYTFDCEY